MTADPYPTIGPTEWLTMCCIWELGSANPIQVSQLLRLRYRRESSPKTTGILLSRLVQKGYLRFSPEQVPRGRPLHLYSPVVAREDALRWNFQKLLDDYQISHQDDLAVLESLLARRRNK